MTPHHVVRALKGKEFNVSSRRREREEAVPGWRLCGLDMHPALLATPRHALSDGAQDIGNDSHPNGEKMAARPQTV